MDAGETVEDTMAREVKEECNLDVMQLYREGALVVDLEVEVYKHKKKRLHAFALFSKEDITQEVKCISFFDKKDKDGNPLPEMDRFEWVSYDEAVLRLHYTQSNLLKKHKKLFETRGSQDE